MVDKFKHLAVFAFRTSHVILIMLVCAYIIYANRRVIWPIHIIHTTEVLTPVVKQGELVYVRAIISRREICEPKVVRFFHNDSSDKIVKITEAPGAVAGLGERILSNPIPVKGSNELEPGKYTVTGYIASNCGNETISVTTIPYSFEIIP